MCLPIAQLLGDVDVKPRLLPLCSTRPEEEGWVPSDLGEPSMCCTHTHLLLGTPQLVVQAPGRCAVLRRLLREPAASLCCLGAAAAEGCGRPGWLRLSARPARGVGTAPGCHGGVAASAFAAPTAAPGHGAPLGRGPGPLADHRAETGGHAQALLRGCGGHSLALGGSAGCCLPGSPVLLSLRTSAASRSRAGAIAGSERHRKDTLDVGDNSWGLGALYALPYALLVGLLAYDVFRRPHAVRKNTTQAVYERFFGIRGSYYTWKVAILQLLTVALQAMGKLMLLSAIVSVAIFEKSNAVIQLQVGFWAFVSLLLANAIYPSILILFPDSSTRFVAASMDAFLDLGYTVTYLAVVLTALRHCHLRKPSQATSTRVLRTTICRFPIG